MRRIVAGGVWFEAVCVLGYGVYLGVETVVAEPAERLAAALLVALVLGLGVALGFAARAVAAGRSAARAPVLVWQGLQASVAWQLVREAVRGHGLVLWLLGVPLLASSVVVAVGVLRRGVLGEPTGPTGYDGPGYDGPEGGVTPPR